MNVLRQIEEAHSGQARPTRTPKVDAAELSPGLSGDLEMTNSPTSSCPHAYKQCIYKRAAHHAVVQGKVAVLARQLTKRFGPPFEQTAARLKSATLGQLDTWADRISPSVCRNTGIKRATLTGSGVHAMRLVGGHNQTPFA